MFALMTHEGKHVDFPNIKTARQHKKRSGRVSQIRVWNIPPGRPPLYDVVIISDFSA